MTAETSATLPSKATATRTSKLVRKRIMIVLIVSAILLYSIDVIEIVPVIRKSVAASQYKKLTPLGLSESEIDHDHDGHITMVESNNLLAQQRQQQPYLNLKPLIQEHPMYKSINNTLQPSSSKSTTSSMVYLDKSDIVYSYGSVVIPKHKLIFFAVPKVGSTAFKQLFRRMMGYNDYLALNDGAVHTPSTSGLVYLHDFPIRQASYMMKSYTWTRVMFVREPKRRLLSAYMDKMIRENGNMIKRCCHPDLFRKPPDEECQKIMNYELQQDNETRSLPFLTNFVPICKDSHWDHQSKRIDDKYWPYISFIGHFETIAQDTKILLERLGLWEEYGSHGWVNNGTIFEAITVKHQTNSKKYVQEYYTPKLEQLVEEMFKDDYDHPQFGYVPQRLSE